MLQALPCHQRWAFLLQSQRTLCLVGSAALGTTQKTQHKEKDLDQQLGHFQVHLTWFESEDLIFRETGHQAPADGSLARGTDWESPCDAPEGTFLWDCYTSTVSAGPKQLL